MIDLEREASVAEFDRLLPAFITIQHGKGSCLNKRCWLFGGTAAAFCAISAFALWIVIRVANLLPSYAEISEVLNQPREIVSIYERAYEQKRLAIPALPEIHSEFVPIGHIPKHVIDAFVAAEDGAFYQHHGTDWSALWRAIKVNFWRLELRYGASTITQQVAKNLFLNTDLSIERKIAQMVLADRIENIATKRQILEVYLNTVELGVGIFGVGSAAKQIWRKPIGEITLYEAIGLAASLPSPYIHTPQTKTMTFMRRCLRVCYGLFSDPRARKSHCARQRLFPAVITRKIRVSPPGNKEGL